MLDSTEDYISYTVGKLMILTILLVMLGLQIKHITRILIRKEREQTSEGRVILITLYLLTLCVPCVAIPYNLVTLAESLYISMSVEEPKSTEYYMKYTEEGYIDKCEELGIDPIESYNYLEDLMKEEGLIYKNKLNKTELENIKERKK